MSDLRLLPTALLLCVCGCMLGPDYEVPEVEVPAEFLAPAPDGESIANVPWWELFEDENLKGLIETALAQNKDLGIALERIAESRAALGFVRADQYPSIRYSGGAARVDTGDNTNLGRTSPSTEYRAGADLFFEVDLWGKLRRATEAARAELLATESVFVIVTITLVADVANAYLLLLDLDEQQVITERTLQARRDATKIIRDRFGEGVVAQPDVYQAEIEEATAAVGVARLERQIAQTEHALQVLLGRVPGSVPRGKGLAAQLPPEIPAGLPSELLQRRPDIQVSQHLAHAETARIGVAQALRFPQLSLTGALGLASEDSSQFFSSNANFWSVGAAAAGPIYEFGKNVRRVEVAQARARQAVLDYERSVLIAFQEVEDALVAVRTYRQEHEIRSRQVEAARGSARLFRALYDEEFSSYLEVLDADRSLFDAELAQTEALRQSRQAVVRLYKALGGGWMPPGSVEK